MRLGWVVFQHGYLYIEATPHAVYDPNDGGPWEACTPMTLQNGEDVKIILFFSDDRRSYDFNTRTEPNRVVVPVTVDPSFLRSLRSQSEYLAVWNAEKPGESPIRPNAMDRLRSENQKDKLFGRARRRAKEAESEESDS